VTSAEIKTKVHVVGNYISWSEVQLSSTKLGITLSSISSKGAHHKHNVKSEGAHNQGHNDFNSCSTACIHHQILLLSFRKLGMVKIGSTTSQPKLNLQGTTYSLYLLKFLRVLSYWC